MVEPVPAADEAAPNSGETAAVPGSPRPAAVEAAWSREDSGNDSEPAADGQSWQATWRKAGALFLGGLAVAGAIVLAFWMLSGEGARPPAKSGAALTSSAPSSMTAPATSVDPSSIASTPEQDQKYIRALNDRGISFANPEAAVYNGKMVCADIRQGMTVPQIVTEFRASNPALGADADAYVAISVHAYCPQHGNLVTGG